MIHFYDTLWLCANFPKWPYCQAYFWCKQILSWFCKPHVMRFYDTWIFSGPDLIIRVDSWNSTIVVTQLLSAFDSVFSFLTTESHTVLQWVVNEIKLYLFLFSSQSAPLPKLLYVSPVCKRIHSHHYLCLFFFNSKLNTTQNSYKKYKKLNTLLEGLWLWGYECRNMWPSFPGKSFPLFYLGTHTAMMR